MFFVIRPVRLLIRALLSQSTPQQMAWGFALGAMLGLVPKGNLLAVVLGILVASLRVNLGVVAVSALIFTLVSPSLDPVSDAVGCLLLGHPSLHAFWTNLANQPLVPWTDFQNSIVTGSLLISIAMLWPLQRLTRPLFERYAEFIVENAAKWRLARILLGAEWADRLGAVE